MKLFRFLGFKADEPGRELTYKELHPTGARKYFGIFFRNVVKIIKLHFLFLLFCLPIITIPASLVAMNKINLLLIMEEGVFLFSDFLRAFKQEFVSSLKLSCIGLIGSVPAVLIGFFYNGSIRQSTSITILFGISIIAAVFFLSYMIIGMKMLPLIDISFSALSRNSFILTFTKVLINFALVILYIILGVLIYVFLPLSLIVIVLPFLAIFNFFTSLLYYYIFKNSKIIVEQGEEPA